MARAPSDLIPRVVTAVVAIPALLGLILFAPPWAFAALVIAAGSIAAWEFARICAGPGERIHGAWFVALLTGLVSTLTYASPAHGWLGLVFASMAIFLWSLFAHREQPRATLLMGSGVTAIVYAGLMLICLALLHRAAGEAGPGWVIVCLGIVWGSDSGAYFAGRALGRHKLFPSVSPNKTVEGAIGALIAGALLTWGLDLALRALEPAWPGLSWWQILALALPGSALGLLGDLCESLLKRAHGVKDSGAIIYGHGGMLDRIDALIFAAPWFYAFAVYFGFAR